MGSNRWGYFPSAAFAWNIAQENFLKESRTVSQLKLRLTWGVTGQQEFDNNYAAIQYAEISKEPTNQYPLGPDEFYYPLKPSAYNDKLKWEAVSYTHLTLPTTF